MRWLLASVLVWAPSPTFAQTGAEAKAMAAYEQGRAAFKAQDFETALKRFEYAYMLDPSPTLLFNLARAAEEGGLAEKAVYYYELYLERSPEGADREEVERRVRVARAMIARQRPPEKPPEQAPKEPAPEEPAPEPARAPSSARPILGWSLVAAGAAGLALGTVFLTDALADADEASGLRPVDADRHARLSDSVAEGERRAWLGYGLGVAAVGAGLAVLLWPEGGGEAAALAPSGRGLVIRW